MRANGLYDTDDYSEAQKLGPDPWLGLPSFPLSLSVHQPGHCQAGLNMALRERPGLLGDGKKAGVDLGDLRCPWNS